MTKRSISYRNGSDKEEVYREFLRRGKDAAIHLGLDRGHPISTLASWTSFWKQHPGFKSYEELRAYNAGKQGKVTAVKAFVVAEEELPSIDELGAMTARISVTVPLSRRSVDFFKREAGKRRVPYQRMIRALVDAYADRQPATKRRR